MRDDCRLYRGRHVHPRSRFRRPLHRPGPADGTTARVVVHGRCDCPALEGCASDGKCHVDGECVNTWQTDGTLAGNCANGLLCVASGENLDGFCTDDRGGP